MSIHICTPQAIIVKRMYLKRCPICMRRRRATAFLFPWYGWDVICHTCGVRIQDGAWRKTFGAQAQRNRETARAGWAEPFDRSAEYWAQYEDQTA